MHLKKLWLHQPELNLVYVHHTAQKSIRILIQQPCLDTLVLAFHI